jgi:hypothetical protein
MTSLEIVDVLAKIAGPISLLIISIPKLAEIVIGRSVSLSIEREKTKLQADLESHKLELASDLERFKSILQQDIIRDQRKYQADLNMQTALAVRAEKFYSSLLSSITGCASSQHQTPQEIYNACTALLEEAFCAEANMVKPLESRLRELDLFIESPGVFESSEFSVSTQELLDRLAQTTLNEITKLRGKN